jgi:hypothetical protein
MRITLQHLCLLVFISLLSFCGSKPSLNVTLTGAMAFNDTNVRDIVFVFQSQATATGILDQNSDGNADFFVYPSQCGATRPAGCGFAPNPGTITVGDLPLDYGYNVIVELRNATGTLLYDGQSTFQNVKDSAGVTIAVE